MVARAKRMGFGRGNINATAALLKFCRQHGHSSHWIIQLEAYLAALKDKDAKRVIELVAPLRRAGMCSFMDWFPPVVYEHEDEEYVEVVWDALLGKWLGAMENFREQDA